MVCFLEKDEDLKQSSWRQRVITEDEIIRRHVTCFISIALILSFCLFKHLILTQIKTWHREGGGGVSATLFYALLLLFLCMV